MDGDPRARRSVSSPILLYRPGLGADGALPPEWLGALGQSAEICTTRERTKLALLRQAPEILLIWPGNVRELIGCVRAWPRDQRFRRG